MCEGRDVGHGEGVSGATTRVGRRHQEDTVTTFIIERSIPGARDLGPEELRGIAQKSNAVVDSLGVDYVWRHSYVAGDKIYCVHETDDAETVREHARRGGFPALSLIHI